LGKSLEKFSCAFNFIYFFPEEMGALEKLQYLNFQSNSLYFIPEKALCALPKVKELFIGEDKELPWIMSDEMKKWVAGFRNSQE